MAVLLIAYILKTLAHDLYFDALLYAFSLIGTREMVKAVGDKLTRAERILVFSFAGICVPCVSFAEMYGFGMQVALLAFFVFAVSCLCLFVLKYEETGLENVGLSLLCAVYPTVMLLPMVFVNHMGGEGMETFAFNSNVAILLIFAVSPISDTFAYLFGKFLHEKFPKKMAETISPNKTMIGGVGSIVGGIVGAVAVFFVSNALFLMSPVDIWKWLSLYILIGIVISIANAFGDLVESAMKRKLGIKDMGKLLPGHGGILDRIDGTMFAGIAVYFVYIVIFLVI